MTMNERPFHPRDLVDIQRLQQEGDPRVLASAFRYNTELRESWRRHAHRSLGSLETSMGPSFKERPTEKRDDLLKLSARESARKLLQLCLAGYKVNPDVSLIEESVVSRVFIYDREAQTRILSVDQTALYDRIAGNHPNLADIRSALEAEAVQNDTILHRLAIVLGDLTAEGAPIEQAVRTPYIWNAGRR